ncbi:2OG-Fe(II) oxygenase [Alteromonas gracilis]|uniref:2OG-Fe(II) oxygenase n=1 Tax=Alteromonas gracilis TaxID=1479524 RepID=UPI002FE199CE
MTIRLNSQLDSSVVSKTFAENGRVRIKNVLNNDDAGYLFKALSQHTKYEMAFVRGGKYETFDEYAWRQLDVQTKRQITDEILKNASEGIGFVYGRHALNNTVNKQLGAFNRWINSEATLNWVKGLSGIDNISAAKVQATRFMPGQFLTRHQDIVNNEDRKIAFVLNLSPEWHPDWGGLLQFFELDGTTTESWAPEFNTLNLFDVEHIHSVTYVTPFTKQPRYSLSGWFVS